MDPDENKAMKQLLVPSTGLLLENMNGLLKDAKALEMSISDEAPNTLISNELRYSVVEALWEEGMMAGVVFTDDELDMGMKEAKAKYDLETFRKWKRARKKAQKL